MSERAEGEGERREDGRNGRIDAQDPFEGVVSRGYHHRRRICGLRGIGSAGLLRLGKHALPLPEPVAVNILELVLGGVVQIYEDRHRRRRYKNARYDIQSPPKTVRPRKV